MKRFAPTAGWLAVCFGAVGLFCYILFPDKPVLAATLALIAAGNAVFFAAADWPTLKAALRGRTAVYGFNTTVLILVVIGILIFVNLIAFRHKQRFDLTASGVFSLADKSRKIAADLPRDIQMTAFFQTESPDKNKFKNLIDGYLGVTDKIKLTYVDPDKNPALAKQHGITLYGTVLLQSGKQESKITNVNEENLTNALIKVTHDDQKTVYFLEGHEEKPILATDKDGYSTVKGALEKDNYKVASLLLLQSGRVPDNAAALIVAGPRKPLPPEELTAVENYLNANGSVFLMLDPELDGGFQPLLQQWGILLHSDFVVDPMSRLFGVDSRAPVINQYPHHDITRNFSLATILPLTRSINSKTVPGVSVAQLMQTAESSWAETDFNSLQIQLDEGKEQKGPVPVMIAATRQASTAPAADKEAAGGGDKTGETPAAKGRLVVLGDSDFATNNYIKFSGNGDLFLNTVSWLARQENLIAIGVKERASSPLVLDRADGLVIFLLGIFVFPALVAGTGIRIWWKRRKL